VFNIRRLSRNNCKKQYELKRKREAEEDVTVKKASAFLDKAGDSDDLKFWRNLLLASFDDCIMIRSERKQREILNSYWIL
jgi:hypothetical protein